MTTKTTIFDEGAVLVEGFMTEREEREILDLIDRAPWSNELRRRVQHYGYRYDYRSGATNKAAPPIPPWAVRIGKRLDAWFADEPTQCIINEYLGGQYIAMHTDHANFGPVVASVSLGAEWPMRFRRRAVRPYARGGLPGDEVTVLPRRSALVLTRAARHHWMHGMDPNDTRGRKRRVSATFRTLAAR